MKPKIVIAAANGYLGRILANYFSQINYEVVGLCRQDTQLENARCVLWDGKTLGAWANELTGAAALINLAGKSVDCRYTKANKQAIINSRVQSTKVLGQAIANSTHPPKVWLNASSATIYRHSEDKDMDETTGEVGQGFSVQVCQKWENELFSFSTPNTTKTALRIAMVLGANGGIYPVLSRLTKLGLGGTMGNGRQYISWIHEADFCRAVQYLIDAPKEGAVNICAPAPITNKQFMQHLRHTCRVGWGMPQPRFTIEIGAFLLQTETELVLKSRRVVPQQLLQSGFTFGYTTVEEALVSLAHPVQMFLI